MLSKSFKPVKCKTSLKLAMARIKLLKNKKEVQLKQMRRELAQLLETGQEQHARIRVEHVIREEKMMTAYDLIEIYCELIVARMPIIESQKSCPIDLKEAITSVVFASPRCADIPELMDVRKHFVAKYGKEFINIALEIRPDCGVSRMMIEKLSAKAPDGETKMKALTAIAQEHNIKWDSKAFEEELHKPHADLLNGPSTFAGTRKTAMESSSAKPSPLNEKNASMMKQFHNDATSKPTSTNNLSSTTINTPSVSSTSQHESRSPDNRPVSGSRSAYSSEGSAFRDQPSWKMEFKDATSAAQAAAESAERASLAARAAAELAKQGNFSRQSSAGSHQSSKPDNADKSKGPKVDDPHIVQESVTEDDLVKRSHGMKQNVQTLQRDEVLQEGPKREEAIYGGYPSSTNSSSRSPRGTYVNDDVSEFILRKAGTKAYDHAQNNHPDTEPLELDFKNKKSENADFDQWSQNAYDHAQNNHHDTEPLELDFKNKKSENADFDQWSQNEKDNKSRFSHLTGDAFEDNTKWSSNVQNSLSDKEPLEQDFKNKKSVNVEFYRRNQDENYNNYGSSDLPGNVFDDGTKWNSSAQKPKNVDRNDSIKRGGDGMFGSLQKQPISSDYSAVVFDDYGSDTDNISIVGRHNEDILSDKISPNQREGSSGSRSNVDPFSPKEHRSVSLAKDGSSHLHFTIESHSPEHSDTRKHDMLPSQSDDDLPPAYDDFDVLGYENEGTLSNSTHKEARKSNRGGDQRSSTTGGSLSEGSGHRLVNPSFTGMNEEDNAFTSPPKSADKNWKTSGSIALHNSSEVSDRDTYYRPPNEEPRSWRSTKVAATDGAERDKFGTAVFPSNFKDTEISNEISPDIGPGLNLGRLSGGLKNKDYGRPPYMKTPSVGASVRSEQTSDGTIERPAISGQHKSSFEFPDQERYDKQAGIEDYASKPRILRASMESESDKAERVASRQTFARGSSKGEDSFSDKTAGLNPHIDERTIVYHQEKITSDLEGPAPKSNRRRYKYNGSETSNSPVSIFNPGSSNLEAYGERPLTKGSKESGSRKPTTDFKSDDNESEEVARRRTAKLSWRTRDLPSEDSIKDGRSDVPVTSGTENKPSMASFPASESLSDTKTSPKSSKDGSVQSVIPANSGDPTESSSSKGSASGESSIKNASHVHPKLPTYESMAAHFHSLRSNIR